MADIKAIETKYKGYRFRSRLEARWAVFFDALGIEWEYEKEGFDLGKVGWYLPDFYFPKFNIWVEIKPLKPTGILKLFMAGKMNDWREKLNYKFHNVIGPNIKHRLACEEAGSGVWGYSGSYPGQYQEGEGHDLMVCDNFETAAKFVFVRNMALIRESDAVFAWIDSLDCYGTLIELGYANGLGKPVFLGMTPELTSQDNQGHGANIKGELWMAEVAATKVCHSDNPQAAFDALIDPPDNVVDMKKCAGLKQRCVLLCGNVGDEVSFKFCENGDIWQGEGFFSFFNWSERQALEAYQAARSARF